MNPNPFRARGALLVGEPNNGKSVILRALQRQLNESPLMDLGPDSIPAVYFDAPVGATWRTLFFSIAEEIRIPLPMRGKADSFIPRIVKGLRQRGTKVLLVDEMNNLVSGPIKAQHQVFEYLRTISNRLGIPVIGAGTMRALAAIELDPQYLSRWPPIILPLWEFKKEYLGVLKGLELEMGLPVGSFSSREHSPLVWELSKGLVGTTVRILNDSLQAAIDSSATMITLEHITRAGFADAPWLLGNDGDET